MVEDHKHCIVCGRVDTSDKLRHLGVRGEVQAAEAGVAGEDVHAADGRRALHAYHCYRIDKGWLVVKPK